MARRLTWLAFLILATSSPVAAQSGAGALSLHFLDVGQGDSTLIVCPNATTILIDGGSLSGRSAADVRAYIDGQIGPLAAIDHLIVSHPDADHYNLLPSVLQGRLVRRAYYVGEASDYRALDMLGWLSDNAGERRRLTADYFDRETMPNPDINCGRAGVWFLAADVRSSQSPSNTKSIVVMARMGDFEAVVTGDATHATENAIMARYPAGWLDIDILRVGHHGSLATSTSPRWASTLSPTTAILSAGYTNGFGHPRMEVVARLTPYTRSAPPHPFRDATHRGGAYVFRDHEDYREDVYTTARSGTIVVSSSGTGYRLITSR